MNPFVTEKFGYKSTADYFLFEYMWTVKIENAIFTVSKNFIRFHYYNLENFIKNTFYGG